ncbi:hypothetical protein AB0I10_32080 [Streptomyces sp. NPDC050636]|uniref:hypothetical protein n=1 Tax=Streptomyces sp. NPDC050636 TaxID=3154510 RepID=UPI00341568DE
MSEAEGGKGWIGYWLHPDEPADRPSPVIELDTEFSYRAMAGSTLVEACAADQAQYHDEPDERIAFSLLCTRLTELGPPLSVNDYDALYEPEFTLDQRNSPKNSSKPSAQKAVSSETALGSAAASASDESERGSS